MPAAVAASGKTNLLLQTPDVPGWKALLAPPAVPCEGSLPALPNSLPVPGLFGIIPVATSLLSTRGELGEGAKCGYRMREALCSSELETRFWLS